MPTNNRKNVRVYDLEDRLINFGAMIGELVSKMVLTLEGSTIRKQLIRSGTAPALNYGEAMVAESRADFIHKMSLCLKELKETRITLKLIILRELCNDKELSVKTNNECSELVAIFVKSVATAKENLKK
jgi:four helix bundle protein